MRCRIADLARSRGPTAGAVSLDAVESTAGFEPPSPGNTPSTYARQDEAVEARPQVLGDTLDELLSHLKNERKFRDLKILELLFSVGVNNKEAAQLADTSEPTVSRTRASLIEEMQRRISRHPKADALVDLPDGYDVSTLIQQLWTESLFSCIKRSTLGSYSLEVLDDDWSDYVRFHLDIAKCDYCAAHLEDIEKGSEGISVRAKERIFNSSVGFLKR